jgi:TonB-linked SusC/RagA family outer membrane protein
MRKFLTLLSVFMLSTMLAWAQGSVNGVVRDPSGEPVPFAVIKVEGTNVTTTADGNGVFNIKAANGASLIISAKGFVTKTVTAATGFNTFIVVKAATGNTEDVVVTALGIKKKPRDLGTAIARVSASELTNGRAPNLAQSLTGKATGLLVQQSSGGVNNNTKIVLRGFRSISGSNDALIVLDGAPVPQNVFNYINPNDIADVVILKGGQAATLYGSDGVNGAILITTKKGTKQGFEVKYNTSVSFDQAAYMPETQDTYGNGSNYGGLTAAENYRPFENQSYGDRYDGSIRVVGRKLANGDSLEIPYSPTKKGRKGYFDLGTTISHDVSVSGGGADSRFYLSAQAVNVKGLIPGDKNDRYSIRAQTSKDFNKLSVNLQANVVNEKVNYTTSDYYFNVLNTAAHFNPEFYKDWKNNAFANPNGFYSAYSGNPFFEKDNERAIDEKTYLNAVLELNYRIKPWLTLTNRSTYAYNNLFGKVTQGKFVYNAWAKAPGIVPRSGPYDGNNNEDYSSQVKDVAGSIRDNSNFSGRLVNDLVLSSKNDFGDFNLTALVGANLQVRRSRAISSGSNTILIENLYNTQFRRGELVGGESKSEIRKYGYYGDANLGYKGYLNLHVSARLDASSVFYSDNRSKSQYQYAYYGADISAVLTDAIPSLKNIKQLNYLKVRAAINRNGNDNLAAYSLIPIFGSGAGFPYGNVAGLTQGNGLPAPNITPEFITSYEAGVEAAFLDNRLNVEFNTYYQKSKDQIVNTTTSPSTGYQGYTLNVGETTNKGFEIDIKGQVIRKKNLSVDLSVRYSRNDNFVDEIAPGLDDINLLFNSNAQVYIKKGQAFPSLRATYYDRDPATGKIIVDASNGYPKLANGLKDFGRTTPRDILGVSANIKYKAFSLAATAEYRGGHVIYNGIGRDLTFTGTGKITTSYDRKPFVVPNSVYLDNSGKYVPNTNIATQNGHYDYWVSHYRTIDENFVTSAAFWKLRDVSLSYTIPTNIVKKTKIFKAATLGIFGRNLIMLTPRENQFGDPELLASTASSGGTIGNGIGFNDTEGALPSARAFGLTLNITF